VKWKWRLMAMTVGIHIVADFYGVDRDILAYVENLKPIFEDTVRDVKLTKISSDYYQFRPFGASGIVLLAESHISFHTWPEHGLITLDIYTCGSPEQAEEAFRYLKNRFNPARVEVVRIERGKDVKEETAYTPGAPAAPERVGTYISL
jgi:S-adenosylmethionine decarboxylase